MTNTKLLSKYCDFSKNFPKKYDQLLFFSKCVIKYMDFCVKKV